MTPPGRPAVHWLMLSGRIPCTGRSATRRLQLTTRRSRASTFHTTWTMFESRLTHANPPKKAVAYMAFI
jgi:hypothetical protein